MPYTYEYPHPAVTADAVVFGFGPDGLAVLLVQRGAPPFESCWAIPGGFVEIDEDPQAAAHRELREETGVSGVSLEQAGAFGAPKRDPRERVISVAYFGLTNRKAHHPRGADDAKAVGWFSLTQLPALAFDHDDILALAFQRLRRRALLGPVGLEVFPRRFQLSELRRLYEAILGGPLESRSFRSAMLRTGVVVPVPARGRGKALHRFNRRAYRRTVEQVFFRSLP